MRPPSVYLEDTVRDAEQRAGVFIGWLSWHPTEREQDLDEGDCCCEWCLACEGWRIVAEVADEEFQKTRDKLDMALMRHCILDVR